MVVGKSPDLVCFALKTFPGACYPTKVRWPRDGIQNQIQMSQAGQCYAGIYHHLLLFNGLNCKERQLVKCYTSSRERGVNNHQNSWREQRDLCPVIGHLLVSRSPEKTPEFLRCMAAWRADQGSFVPWNPLLPTPPHLTRSLVQDLLGLQPVKKKRRKMKTRTVATPSTAGALTKAGGRPCCWSGGVGPSKLRSVPVESGNQYWGFIGCPATRFYWPAWPDLLTHNFSSTQITSWRCYVAFGVHQHCFRRSQCLHESTRRQTTGGPTWNRERSEIAS